MTNSVRVLRLVPTRHVRTPRPGSASVEPGEQHDAGRDTRSLSSMPTSDLDHVVARVLGPYVRDGDFYRGSIGRHELAVHATHKTQVTRVRPGTNHGTPQCSCIVLGLLYLDIHIPKHCLALQDNVAAHFPHDGLLAGLTHIGLPVQGKAYTNALMGGGRRATFCPLPPWILPQNSLQQLVEQVNGFLRLLAPPQGPAPVRAEQKPRPGSVFCPYRADQGLSQVPGRCPGLCCPAPLGLRTPPTCGAGSTRRAAPGAATSVCLRVPLTGSGLHSSFFGRRRGGGGLGREGRVVR